MASDWPNEVQAAKTLGISTKTLLRYAKTGKIEMRKRPRPGLKPENVFHPADIQRLQPPPHVIRSGEAPRPEAGHLSRSTTPNSMAGEVLAFLRIIATAIETERQIVQMPKLWLTLGEAAECGLAKADLLRLCREGRLTARKSGGWRIQRASLEAFTGSRP